MAHQGRIRKFEEGDPGKFFYNLPRLTPRTPSGFVPTHSASFKAGVGVLQSVVQKYALLLSTFIRCISKKPQVALLTRKLPVVRLHICKFFMIQEKIFRNSSYMDIIHVWSTKQISLQLQSYITQAINFPSTHFAFGRTKSEI